MDIFNTISQIGDIQNINDTKNKTPQNGENFLSILKDTINEINTEQENAEKASASIATGTVKDLHQAAIAIDKAEINMKMMLEVRNKALTAYKDILRTQV